MIFGTLLSSQGTDASFVLTRSNTYWGFPPGFRSSFPTLPDRFPSRFRSAFSIRGRWGLCLSAFHHFSALSPQLIIESSEIEFGHAECDPARGEVLGGVLGRLPGAVGDSCLFLRLGLR
ncbi:hypothetical protein C0216_22255 [Streptomyces globosus]|uniref:Uncharacterized protein n=1 Tax=Streptomyces globosus TaxID=68209 RepID=A0A344U4I9_9ACTN|nr:hypothetical protein C0216_22255 [Streptomyces globosus]